MRRPCTINGWQRLCWSWLRVSYPSIPLQSTNSLMSPRYSLIALSTSLALLVSCGSQSEKPEASVSRTPPISVKAVTLAETEVPEIYTAPGTVRAKTSSILSSKVLAYVQSVNVHEGQRVRAGQT